MSSEMWCDCVFSSAEGECGCGQEIGERCSVGADASKETARGGGGARGGVSQQQTTFKIIIIFTVALTIICYVQLISACTS